MDKREVLRTEVELYNDYNRKGAIITYRATWYEQGENKNKYFLNLESAKGKKSTIRKVVNEEDTVTLDPLKIMNELRSLYAELQNI